MDKARHGRALSVGVSLTCDQTRAAVIAALPQDFMDRAARHAWPGNVRELRNAVERAALLPHHPALQVEPQSVAQHGGDWATIDVTTPFKVAKQKLVDEFDRRYLETLLELHDGNISAAARAAGIDRMSIYKMMRRLGLSDEAPAEE